MSVPFAPTPLGPGSSPVLKAPARRESPAMSETDIAAFKPKSDFIRVMQERGYIHQCSDIEALDKAASEGAITAYVGYDATASSLHIGSLISIMMMRRMQQTGHRPLPLMGGGTTKVGDPSDKDSQRPLLTNDQIAANIAGIKTVFDRFLRFDDSPTGAFIEDNARWLDKLGYVDFLREYGVHFTINRMLTFDSVKRRLEREQPLTFLEFNYMLMQATDFLELNRLYGANLQMGGSDQWGNIINGVELIRRMDGKQAFALTTPLLTTASGAKMGKTVSGAVWLNADLMSPYDYWQFWRNTEDADVGKFLKLFTDLPLDEIARLEALEGSQINEAKKVLADEATALLHGADAARAARETSEKAFAGNALEAELPTVRVLEFVFGGGFSNTQVAIAAGFAPSNTAARKLIGNGGLRINGEKQDDPEKLVEASQLSADKTFVVSSGKKKLLFKVGRD
jgi:tyrosyl-tRNA synthetase